MNRPDDPIGVSRFEGAYYGGKALIVLGGSSGDDWELIKDKIRPDVILGANGTCFVIDNLHFHLVVENMHMAANRAARGEERYKTMMGILRIKHNAKVRMVSYLSWDLIDDRANAVKIRRMGELGSDYEGQIRKFSFRKYGEGFLAGPLFDHPGALSSPRIQFRVGTVATQLLHLAGILGVREVHTVGMDFCFKGNQHHWYKYTNYQPDRFRTDVMFTEHKGLKTQFDWLQGAKWLKSIEWMFERDGLEWIDHSDGLLKAEGLQCTLKGAKE